MADPTTINVQKILLQHTQRRLAHLMKLLSAAHLSKPTQSSQPDRMFEELVRRSLIGDMMNTGFSSGPFGLSSTAMQPPSTPETETEVELSTLCDGKQALFLYRQCKTNATNDDRNEHGNGIYNTLCC